MSFTDQKARIATEKDCQARWGGEGPGVEFRCYICGHKFIPGDIWRWVYSAGRTFQVDGKTCGLINFLVCSTCDGDDILDRWVKHSEEGYQRFWWK